MTTEREKPMNTRDNVPKLKPVILSNDKQWGTFRGTAMSVIKAQANRRKRPVTLAKINLPE